VAGLHVEPCDPGADSSWDRFVASHPAATAYHLSAWGEILARSYRFRPHALRLSDSNGRTRGVLPLLAKRGIVSGRRLRSLPVVPSGGPLAESDAGMKLLVDHAVGLVRASGGELVVETRQGGLERSCVALERHDAPPSWILELPVDDPESWRRGRSKNLLRNIKKARHAGLVVRESTAEDELRSFYQLYLQTMRGHRFPPRLYRQLKLARDLLPAGVFKLFVVEHDSRVVAGGIFHILGKTIELLYNASDPNSLGVRPNHALYSFVMDWGGEHGLQWLDFGFAHEESPLGAFKAQWGANAVKEYSYVAHGGHARDRTLSMSASDGGNGLAARAWRRMPLPLTRLAGFVTYRYL
jgi:hypothetical protein